MSIRTHPYLQCTAAIGAEDVHHTTKNLLANPGLQPFSILQSMKEHFFF